MWCRNDLTSSATYWNAETRLPLNAPPYRLTVGTLLKASDRRYEALGWSEWAKWTGSSFGAFSASAVFWALLYLRITLCLYSYVCVSLCVRVFVFRRSSRAKCRNGGHWFRAVPRETVDCVTLCTLRWAVGRWQRAELWLVEEHT